MHQVYLYVAVTCLVAVMGQSPVTVCQPAVYQVNYTNLLTGDTGYIVVDFSKDLMAEISTKTNIRLVKDFKNLKTYEIPNNSSCRQSTLSPCKVQHQCLPPYARLVPQQTGVIGNPRSGYYLTTQTWEIPTAYDVLYRITYTSHSGLPSWPVLSQELGYRGTNNIYQFVSPLAAITDTKALVIPNNCVPNDVLAAIKTK
ncbi:Ovipostatin 5 [Biomphalaria pfeifferi]|uniref:Ovipostatin 5 n=1 Tax=Biomphalaria pfeifferi TaxID=112525 RepID=A0AAD8C297_BIOPF|nr:Ovipostatin 5 [Biomphalaria pfeifferi]